MFFLFQCSEEVRALSPIRHLDQLSLPAGFSCLVVWGEQESPEYKRQSKEYIKVHSPAVVSCDLGLYYAMGHVISGQWSHNVT